MNAAEERAEAAAIDVEGRQARLAQVLAVPNGGSHEDITRNRDAMISAQIANTAKPAKKTRSDKGSKRPKKAGPAAQVAGALSAEQVEMIRTLMEKREQALEANTKAEQAMLDACSALDTYLDSLTAK